ncbi:MAG: Flp1 family type IVb pilin [Bdellovibrio sp.]
MKKVFSRAKLNEKGQGTAEYVLLLVIVIGLIVAFKEPITAKVNAMIGRIGAGMDSVAN